MNVWSHVGLSLCVRLGLLIYGLYHDKNFFPKYTDVDYSVFTDAAVHVSKGESPFDRPTYRYTPLLAFLMLPNVFLSHIFGKLLFVLVDVTTGYLIFKYVEGQGQKEGQLCGALWWYNPLCLAVSTRGNAESLMACASVATLLLLRKEKIFHAAVVYGISVHFKLYTIIYALPIYMSLNDRTSMLRRLLHPSRDCLVFAFASALAFLVPTLLSYVTYGHVYVEESILYHLSRKDIRHNFSPYFYLLYLTDTWPSSKVLSFVVFAPQLAILILLGVTLGRKEDLPLCFFSQTFVLVMFNKVCTSQYFLWFLCFLPLIVANLKKLSPRSWLVLTLEWFLGQGLWLLAAYLLEFKSMNTYLYIWLSSLLFLGINAYILQQILISYQRLPRKLD